MVGKTTASTTRDSFCILEVQIRTFLCNIKCTYCDIGRAGSRRSELAIRNDTSGVLDSVRDRITQLTRTADFPLLKLIGGEVFVIPGFAGFVSGLAGDFETVLITTNGTLLGRQIEQLGLSGNVVLQISLDGHDLAMNRHRFESQEQLDTILGNLGRALDHGLRVEINCVISSANVGRLGEFSDYLQRQYSGRVTLQPFPVRWRRGEVWNDEDSATEFDRLIQDHHRYRDVLPPLAYLHVVREFLLTGRRSLDCQFPKIYVGLSDDGSLRMCNCLPLKELSVDDTQREPLGKLWQTTRGMNRLAEGKRLSGMCNTCVDQFDLLTLALQGKFDVEELGMFPGYSGRRFLENLKRARDSFCGE